MRKPRPILAMLVGLCLFSVSLWAVAHWAPAAAGQSPSPLHRLTAFLADARLTAAQAATLDAAWARYPDAARRRTIADLAARADGARVPYQRALLRDKLIAIVYCAVPASSSDRPLQTAMADVVRAHAPLVVAACTGATPYVVTRADVVAFLAEMRFLSAQTGVQAGQFAGPLDEWAAGLRAAFPTAGVLSKERLAHAESRWLLVRTVWDSADAASRREILQLVHAGAGRSGNLGDGAIHLHATLILSGTRAQMNANLRNHLNAAMGAQGFIQGAMDGLRGWGN